MRRPAARGRAAGWALYDRLLAGLPRDEVVRRYLIGQGWTVVDSAATGLSMTFPRPGTESRRPRPSRAGGALADLAADVTSWDFGDAALAMAAINSWYNDPRRLRGLLGRPVDAVPSSPVFTTMADEVAGLRVAVVGHFPDVDVLAGCCDLTVLERVPQPGDLPDPACEYLLPEQDYVFITGVTVVNKTLPRLLELSAGARVVLVGPSVPFTPAWFDLGVYALAGSVVVDPQTCWRVTCEGGAHEIWEAGAAVRLQVRAADFAPTGTVAGPPTTGG